MIYMATRNWVLPIAIVAGIPCRNSVVSRSVCVYVLNYCLIKTNTGSVWMPGSKRKPIEWIKAPYRTTIDDIADSITRKNTCW